LEIKAKEAKEAKEAKGKRAAVDNVRSGSGPSKRKRVDNEDGEESDDDAAGQLPAGFFSAGNPASTSSNAKIKDSEPIPEEAEPPAPTGDAELDDFLASLSGPTEETTAASTISTGATKPAKPGSSYRSKGELGVASYEAAPVRLVQEEQAEVAPEEPEETEAERRARIAREEKEEIMDRLEEEQLAQ
jgi:zinc finger protein 830